MRRIWNKYRALLQIRVPLFHVHGFVDVVEMAADDSHQLGIVGPGHGNTDTFLRRIANHQREGTGERQFHTVVPVMIITDQFMDAADKPRDNAGRHEVIRIMELKITGGTV